MDRLYEPFFPTLVALSGKASGVLAEATNREASTIHRALGFSGGCFMHNLFLYLCLYLYYFYYLHLLIFLDFYIN